LNTTQHILDTTNIFLNTTNYEESYQHIPGTPPTYSHLTNIFQTSPSYEVEKNEAFRSLGKLLHQKGTRRSMYILYTITNTGDPRPDLWPEDT
jgi:hypothetical protein